MATMDDGVAAVERRRLGGGRMKGDGLVATTMIKAPTDDGETGGGNDDGDGELLAMTGRWFDWIFPEKSMVKQQSNGRRGQQAIGSNKVVRQTSQTSDGACRSMDEAGQALVAGSRCPFFPLSNEQGYLGSS